MEISNQLMAYFPDVYTAYENGFKYCIVPFDNVCEAGIIDDVGIIGVKNIKEMVEILNSEDIAGYISDTKHKMPFKVEDDEHDLSDIRGQEGAKRAVEMLFQVCTYCTHWRSGHGKDNACTVHTWYYAKILHFQREWKYQKYIALPVF